MPSAHARHILVETEQECQDIINKLQAGEDFAEQAMLHSTCPSGEKGGDLGEFQQGMMVPEFDAVIFDANNPTGQVYPNPVKTQFGYHVIEILSRNDS